MVGKKALPFLLSLSLLTGSCQKPEITPQEALRNHAKFRADSLIKTSFRPKKIGLFTIGTSIYGTIEQKADGYSIYAYDKNDYPEAEELKIRYNGKEAPRGRIPLDAETFYVVKGKNIDDGISWLGVKMSDIEWRNNGQEVNGDRGR